MFYFYFEARDSPETAPVVLWMTGGPGCSSELAVFYEQGPYRINEDLTLEVNEYGWDKKAHMIFVDQPINTGFSFSNDSRDRVYDETVVAADMLDFLQAFFKAHPELAKRDFFVTGESYAGHYVPAVSDHIFRVNKKLAPDSKIPLRGFAVGNGLTDPAIQYNAYGDFALANKLISSSTRSKMASIYPLCRIGVQLCNSINFGFLCELALAVCQNTQFAPVIILNPGINVYDIRKKCEGPLCYDFSRLEQYINQPSVRKELGVGDRLWEACDMQVHAGPSEVVYSPADMMGDWMKRYDLPDIPEMLEGGVRGMVYAGAEDLICNWLGNQRWVDAMPWSGHAEWQTTPAQNWSGGSIKQVGPLSFVKVASAGHMVPMDVPAASLKMIEAFITDSDLADCHPQHTGQAQLSIS
eukprot:jgi/Astpho2/5629/fgenesh1_pm.00079_%23_36_t